jgi:hypothetical protein
VALSPIQKDGHTSFDGVDLSLSVSIDSTVPLSPVGLDGGAIGSVCSGLAERCFSASPLREAFPSSVPSHGCSSLSPLRANNDTFRIFEPSVSNDSLSLRFSASLADEDCHRSVELASSPPAQFNVASPISSGSVAWSLSPRASHVLASGSANLDAEVVALDPADDATGRPPILPPLRRSPPPIRVSVGDGRGRCAPRRSVRVLDRALSRVPSGCGRY